MKLGIQAGRRQSAPKAASPAASRGSWLSQTINIIASAAGNFILISIVCGLYASLHSSFFGQSVAPLMVEVVKQYFVGSIGLMKQILLYLPFTSWLAPYAGILMYGPVVALVTLSLSTALWHDLRTPATWLPNIVSLIRGLGYYVLPYALFYMNYRPGLPLAQAIIPSALLGVATVLALELTVPFVVNGFHTLRAIPASIRKAASVIANAARQSFSFINKYFLTPLNWVVQKGAAPAADLQNNLASQVGQIQQAHNGAAIPIVPAPGLQLPVADPASVIPINDPLNAPGPAILPSYQQAQNSVNVVAPAANAAGNNAADPVSSSIHIPAGPPAAGIDPRLSLRPVS